MKYRISLLIQTDEEIIESEVSDRIESPNWDPKIEVLDCHVEEEPANQPEEDEKNL